MRILHSKCTLLAACFPVFTGLAAADPQSAGEEDAPVSYWNQVRPIFQAKCHGCHQPAKAKGEYIMTDVPRLIAGGESEAAVVLAHKPAESYLLEQVTPVDGKAEMPPRDEPLLESEIALITRWVAQGAVDDTPENAHQKYDMERLPVYEVPPVVTALDYSPDGSLLAVAGFHEVLLHKADGSGLLARLVGLSERIESVAFSPDGTMLAVTGGLPGRMGEVQVWEIAKRELKVSVPVTYDTVYGASWSPDSRLVAFGCGDNTVRAIEAKSGKQVLFMGGHNDWVLDTVFSRDGAQVVSVGRDMTAKHTEVATERLIDNLTSITPGALKGGLAAVAAHPQRDEVLVGGSDGVPQIFRLKRQTARKIGDNANLVRKFPAMKGRIWDVAFSPDGKRVAAVSSLDGNGTVNLYSAEYDSGIPDDIKKIFNKTPSGDEKRKLEEYWAREVKLLHSIDLPGAEMFSLAFSPDGKTLATSGADGSVRLLETASGTVRHSFIPVEVAGKGVRLASSGERKPLNLKRGKRAELSGRAPEPAEVEKLMISPDAADHRAPHHYTQVVVTAQLKAGGSADVTRFVSWRSEKELVTVSERGLVQPVADGQGSAFATFGDHVVPLLVDNRDTGKAIEPDYVRDVKPVISRLGCDAGTCHGAKDGKNGFKLSLRGYDPLFDVRAFGDDIAARRVNYPSPDDSLMLMKATGAVPHEGQQVTEPGSEYYDLIRDWIANGADLRDPAPVVESIEVFPRNPVIEAVGGQQQLRVVATYKDGTRRDVTRESFIESANGDVAKHDDFGLMTTMRRGEAPVLARYEGAYAATTVTVMGDRSGFAWSDPPSHNEIDPLVAAKWKRMKIRPSGLCSDEEFLRRVHLDLTGLPPDAEGLRAFLADERPTREKRDAVIDSLIGSPAFVDHWANKWADLLMVNSKFLGGEGSSAFRDWIRGHVERNTPYDEFVYAILTASGSNKENPAASYFKIHRTPDLLMENTTHLFLATRFNCNKCHDHPFERWTQNQYYETAAYFAQVKLEADGKNSGNKRIGGTAVEGAKPLYEIAVDKPGGEITHERTGSVTAPAFPYPARVAKEREESTRREQLASWLTAADNRYFAMSYANRVWGYLLGTGIIEPLDDIRAGNPPSNPELLEHLTSEFVGNNFDVRKLIATICKSRTYQLAIATNKWNGDDTINFSHAKARRLPAEVLLDAVYKVTGSKPRIEAKKADARQDTKSGLLATLGRPPRESACECDRSNDVQLSGVMALLTGPDVADAIADPGNAIAKLVKEVPDDRQLIEEIYLRVLNRSPGSGEVEAVLASWGQLEADHQKVMGALAAREKEWAPVRDEREAKRQAAIQEARSTLEGYRPEHEKLQKRLATERETRIAEARKAVADYEAGLPKKVAEYEETVKASQLWARWHLVRPSEAALSDKSKVQILPDGSIRAEGGERNLDYLLTSEVSLTNITGIMVESVPDPSYPAFGAGLSKDGNFVITELQARWKAKAEGAKDQGLAFADARADFTQKDFDAKRVFDGNLDRGNRGWAISGTNLQVPHRAMFKLKDPMVGAAEGSLLTVGVLCRFTSHPIGRFRLYVTDAPDPLQLGLPAAVADTLTTVPAARSAEQVSALQAFVAENDAELQKRRAGIKGAEAPVPPDKKLGELEKALQYVEQPIEVDPRYLRAKADAEMSGAQLADRRLTAAQDLTWALINNPAFLFNH